MNQLYKRKDWKVAPTSSTISDNSQTLNVVILTNQLLNWLMFLFFLTCWLYYQIC